jgi:5-methylthioadenosine/S-adenosylhomocysteine deaminase
MWNVVPNLVYSGDGSLVDNVIIDGRIIMKDKEILTINAQEVLEQVKESAAKLKERLNLNIPSQWPII